MNRQIMKPSILPGFMELLPEDQMLFNKMLDTIRKSYENYGFIPVDTPVIEKAEVLLAKGGGETEKQIYRFQKGDTDLALRFDLTVPLARYVAQHFDALNFPFRRYHIGKVYRGERNQKGRFREFYQCDIDIIGSGKLSIANDAEIPCIIYSTFKALGFDNFTIHINNRKILNGLFEALGIENKTGVLRSIDKLEKIGEEAVAKELEELGVEKESIYRVMEFMKIKGNNKEILEKLTLLEISNVVFKEGVEELCQVIQYIEHFHISEENYHIDLTIARGLDYYTGTIYETTLDEYPSIGSVCSGGRYDNLAEYYTTQKLPGVGISIGLTRLFYQLREGNILKGETSTPSKILLLPMAGSEEYAISVARELRQCNIPTEIYFEDTKMSKKFTYADKLGVPYVIVIGTDEMESGILTVKDMKTGEQHKINLKESIEEAESTSKNSMEVMERLLQKSRFDIDGVQK